MSFQSVLDKIEKLPPFSGGDPVIPPPEIIAFFVRWIRGMRNLKKEALAALAQVSLSTVERIERGEPVTPECLDRVGMALGFPKGYLTNPRVPIAPETAIGKFVNTFEWLQEVHVRPLRTEAQVRSLAECHSFLPFAPEDDPAQVSDLHQLIEWIDLIAFVSDKNVKSGEPKPPRRRLYRDALECAASMHQKGWTVLAGVVSAPQQGIAEWRVGVLSVTSRSKDPGALKRRSILVDKRYLK